MAAYQYIYVMKGLSKTYPGGREVLKDIWLSFLPGTKIGVLRPNGAGKSTLLRIMAGDEREFAGEAWAAEGARVGYLPREPALDETKDVFGNVIEGLAASFAEDLSEAEMDALVAEQGELREGIDQAGARDLDRTVEIAKDALHWRRSTSKRAGASESWPVPPPEVHGPRTIAAVMLADGA
jgi:ATPase subunit of ABC transporter with duplicated ATPase domains